MKANVRGQLRCFSTALLIGALTFSAACSGGASSDAASDTSSDPQDQAETTRGYCAVGEIDTTAKTASILREDGSIHTVVWEGNAPQTGVVNKYEISNEIYRFSVPETQPAYGSGSVRRTVYTIARAKKYSVDGEFLYTDENSVVFVRYSDTDWRVFRGRQAMKTDPPGAAGETHAYVDARTELDGLARVVNFVMIVGVPVGRGEEGAATKNETMFLDPGDNGWDSGDKVLTL